MNPFTYPKSRHVRTLTPRNYASHTSYKPFLRNEFERKCVYCRMPDTFRGQESFGVDHYRPQKLFPYLKTTYSNLFYCCNACNSRKGSYWPSGDHASSQFIPNPCDHEMFGHLRFNHAIVETKTRAGKFTQELLDLNDPEIVGQRETVLHIIKTYETKKNELQALAAHIRSQHEAGNLTSSEAELALAEISMLLDPIDKVLLNLYGRESA